MVEVASVTLGNVQTVDAIDAGHSNCFQRLIESVGAVVSSFQLARLSAAIVGCWVRSRNHVLNPSLSGRDPGCVPATRVRRAGPRGRPQGY
jgi:hypothetical protein